MHPLARILIQPRAAALEIRKNPRWLGSFLILGALSLLVQILIDSHAMGAMLDRLPPSATTGDKTVVGAMIRGGMFTRLAFFPVRLLAGWAVYSLALYYACRSFFPPGLFRMRHILALEVHAEVVPLLEKIGTLILAAGGRMDAPMQVPFSLATVVHADSFSWYAVLSAFNPFEVLYVALLGAGISAITGLRWWKAGAASAGVWGLSVMANAAMIAVLNDSLHFRL